VAREELRARLRVLRRLGYVGQDGVVTLKVWRLCDPSVTPLL
jgi:hypothetical protein